MLIDEELLNDSQFSINAIDGLVYDHEFFFGIVRMSDLKFGEDFMRIFFYAFSFDHCIDCSNALWIVMGTGF